MYCKNCGTEIDGNSKFCGSCGAALQDAGPSKESSNMQQGPASPDGGRAAASALAYEGKSIIRKFFSKDSGAAISDAAQNSSFIWIVFIAINILLFALAACLNISQMANHIINSLSNSVAATASSTVGSSIAGALVGSKIPQIPVKDLFGLFAPLALLALIMFVTEFVGIYIALKIDNKRPKSYLNVANVVGVASFPLSIGLTVNLIIGLIYPPATLLIFGTALFVNMTQIYDGLKSLSDCEKAPVKEFAIVAAFLCLIVLIAFGIGVQQVGQLLQSTISNAIGGTLKDGLGSVFGDLGNLFG